MSPAPDALEALLAADRAWAAEAPLSEGVRLLALARLPTEFGHFRVAAFENAVDGREHVALIHGNVVNQRAVPVRMHSECMTGDAFGSLRCDCRAQLHAALRRIKEHPCGVLLYLRQEGRGIGLNNKLRAYQLQDHGLDTVDANLALGFQDDERDYRAAAEMLKRLKIQSVNLITNNPNKLAQLDAHGVPVEDRIAHVMRVNAHNADYLATKAQRSGHLIDARDLFAARAARSR
jgi:GTP cyclohydrolase II